MEKPPPLRILLAEDNPVNQRVAQLILGKLGQQADVVDNGADAVLAVRQTPYDVVLMDVRMPKVDGLEATRQIRADGVAQPHIVAITAGALLEEREACRSAGMDSFLAKPVRTGELRDVLLQIASAVIRGDRRVGRLAAASVDDADLASVVRDATTVVVPTDLLGGAAVVKVADENVVAQDANGDQLVVAEAPVSEAMAAEAPVVQDPVSQTSVVHEPVAVGAEAPAIDTDIFEGLMDELEDEAGELRVNLIDSYLDDGELHVSKLLEAVGAGDLTTARMCAHTLRSTSALMGATWLATLLQDTEDATRATPADEAAIAEAGKTVRDEYLRVRTSLSMLATSKDQTVRSS